MATNRLTLNSKYILKRMSGKEFKLFNTLTSIEYKISNEFYSFLKIFKNNLVNIDEVINYFHSANINMDKKVIQETLNKEEFSDLLIESEEPYLKSGEKEVPFFNLPAFVDNTPTRIDLLLTERCNLRCLHCFQESTPLVKEDFPPLEKLYSLFDEIEYLEVETLKISGGELLMHPQIKEILAYLANKRFKKSLLTNAILIDDDIINILKDKNFRLGISLDGSCAEIHEFLRGRNTFDRTIRNVKKLKENGIIFSMTATLHRNNYQDLINIARLAHGLGASQLNINKIAPLGRGGKNDISLTAAQIEFIKDEVVILQKELGDRFSGYSDPKELLKKDLNGDMIACSAGTKILAISPQLEVYPCTYGFHNKEYKMGSLYDETLSSIWTNNKWELFRGKVKLNDLNQCGSCSFNKRCMHRNCRLKPVYQGNSFYDAISYCRKSTSL